MTRAELNNALQSAVKAARLAGNLMSDNARSSKRILSQCQHDIKLELDVKCQKLIESALRKAWPDISILGEEGVLGDPSSPCRWVVDPIDGTVNFTYGIPHACVSIALQQLKSPTKSGVPKGGAPDDSEYENLVGVVFDPFCNEMFTGVKGQPARLNGRIIRVSQRDQLEEAIISLGFAKTKKSLDYMLPVLKRLTHRVRKVRIFGAAALSLAYIAAGRMDAYVETGLRLWDIAAGGLILECAGGDFCHEPVKGDPHTYRILVNNGLLRQQLIKACKLELQ